MREAERDRPPSRQIGNGFYQSTDLTLTFESAPDFPLAFESLDMPRSGIVLLAVRRCGRTDFGTVRIPERKNRHLHSQDGGLRDSEPEIPLEEGQRRPRDYRKLMESISVIRLATLRQFWTDDPANIPKQARSSPGRSGYAAPTPIRTSGGGAYGSSAKLWIRNRVAGATICRPHRYSNSRHT